MPAMGAAALMRHPRHPHNSHLHHSAPAVAQPTFRPLSCPALSTAPCSTSSISISCSSSSSSSCEHTLHLSRCTVLQHRPQLCGRAASLECLPMRCWDGRMGVITRSAAAGTSGPAGGSLGGDAAALAGGDHTLHSPGGAFKRKTKGLLKKKSGDLTHAPEQSSVATAAAAVALPLPSPSAVDVVSSAMAGLEENVAAAERFCSAAANNLGKHRALVLDCAYRPINVISWAKAVMMDWTAKAEVVEYYPPPATALSGQGQHSLPAVIRVVNRYVDLNEVASDVSCTRRNVLVRDKFTCQYCGMMGKELTLDHIVPVSKGGRNSWLNLVAACMPCNQKKGDKLLQHLGWKLRSTPKRPSPWELGLVIGLNPGDVDKPCPEWAPYVEPYRQKIREIKRRAQQAGVSESSTDEDDA